jgi:hypothetical protein
MGSFALLPPGLVLIGIVAGGVGATTVMGVAGATASLLVLVALLPRETRGLRRRSGGAEPALHSGVTPGTSGDVVP